MNDKAGWQAQIVLTVDQSWKELESELSEIADAVSILRQESSDGWRLTAYFSSEPDGPELRDRVHRVSGRCSPHVAIGPVEDRDWVAASNSTLPALDIGRFHVYGSHALPSRTENRVDIRIDAGLAFGTGHHESTSGCLEAFEGLYSGAKGPRRALDLGTGSGILAIALARAFGTRVLAVDVDPVALDVARDNIALNRVTGLVHTLASDGSVPRKSRRWYPVDLIVANIEMRTLIALVPGIAASLSSGGRIVLSGILAAQEETVSEAYGDIGIGVTEAIRIGEWTTLVLSWR